MEFSLFVMLNLQKVDKLKCSTIPCSTTSGGISVILIYNETFFPLGLFIKKYIVYNSIKMAGEDDANCEEYYREEAENNKTKSTSLEGCKV